MEHELSEYELRVVYHYEKDGINVKNAFVESYNIEEIEEHPIGQACDRITFSIYTKDKGISYAVGDFTTRSSAEQTLELLKQNKVHPCQRKEFDI